MQWLFCDISLATCLLALSVVRPETEGNEQEQHQIAHVGYGLCAVDALGEEGKFHLVVAGAMWMARST